MAADDERANMGDRLAGKVALVSGAGRGIGAAVARRLVCDGARVVCGDLNGTAATEVAASLGGDGLGLHLDVRSEASWAEVVTAATEHFGTIGVLVNNAGILRALPIVATSLEEFRETVEVNQIGVFLGLKTVAPLMAVAGSGSIVNVSSMLGLVGQAFAGAYTASKFAVTGLTKVAALEFASAGVRVNSVHPGYIGGTEMLSAVNLGVDFGDTYDVANIPLKRMGSPEEVADLVCYLASDESRYCTGAEFVIDGGLIAGVPGTTTL
jgi:3alpha(or 20beta)-hydroxysteroid dehydrogenase